MTVAKTIEITAESTTSFDDAIKQGIATASKSVEGIKSAWVKDQIVSVDNGQVTGYRVRLSVTFALK